jgi:alkylhydroperoxidase family enzyme
MVGMFAGIECGIRELAIMYRRYTLGSWFVFSQHCKAVRKNGVPDEKVEVISRWQLVSVYDEKESSVPALRDALIHQGGRALNKLFLAVHKYFSDEGMLEITYHVLGYNLHAVLCKRLRLEFDAVEDRVREVPVPVDKEPADWAANT